MPKNLGVISGSTDEVTKGYVDAGDTSTLGLAAPTGVINAYGGSSAPNGWLLCDGSAVSRTTYAALFAVLSTTYGSGDGSTTFNLPDLRVRFPLGAGTRAAGGTAPNNVSAQTVAAGTVAGTDLHTHTLAHTHTANHAHTVTDPGHTHSVGAHQHTLSSAAWAQIQTDTPNKTLNLNIVSPVTSYTALRAFVVTSAATESVAETGGVPLDGHTDNSSAFTSGNNTTQLTVDSASVTTAGQSTSTTSAPNGGAPPYTAVNFIIKT